MERNTLTTFENLQTGDRFYQLKDKKKIVFEVQPQKEKNKYAIFHSKLAKEDNHVYAVSMRSSTEVVFLRHKTQS